MSVNASTLKIDFLFLDLSTCARCRGTGESLDSALEIVHDLLAATETEVQINRIQVTSAEQARELRFVSSPTIRVNGRDAALELRESPCGSEACTDGCGESISCRVWVHRGDEHTEAPVAVIVDAILRALYAGDAMPHAPETVPYELPGNLERFFAGAGEPTVPQLTCCSPAEQLTCCASQDKAACCGAASAGEACGCR